MTSNFAIRRKSFTLSVISLKNSPFSWALVKNVDAEGKFSVSSLIMTTQSKPVKSFQLKTQSKATFFKSSGKGLKIVDHLFSI
jgi:hypothetical protein